MSALHTTDFRREFDAETGALLRRRFFWLLGASGMVYVLSLLSVFLIFAVLLFAPASDTLLVKQIENLRLGRSGLFVMLGLSALDIAMYIWAAVHVRRTHMQRERLLRFTQWALVYRGVVDLIAAYIMRDVSFPWALGMYHILACCFLPWTPQQALRPMGPLLVLNALMVLIFSDMGPTLKAFVILMSLFAAAPGTLICFFKQSRRVAEFKTRMMHARYGELKRELYDAQRIHEALFPPSIDSGPLVFQYRYQPMRQIGGDYLYARFSPSPEDQPAAFNVLLLDVTGHGIAAALTVNRLYGEVERLFAENPDAGPGEVLSALNKYVHLTLATHSVYVTALCMKIDQQNNTLMYASGGHPPAFLCAVDGTIEQLDSTALILGPCAGVDFYPDVQTRRFGPGDTLLAYTDGAIEARNSTGRMLTIAGFTKVLAGAWGKGGCVGKGTDKRLCDIVLEAVEMHRAGMAEDDTLLVEITRGIETGRAAVTTSGRAVVPVA